jgi:hypothetical protein
LLHCNMAVVACLSSASQDFFAAHKISAGRNRPGKGRKATVCHIRNQRTVGSYSVHADNGLTSS